MCQAPVPRCVQKVAATPNDTCLMAFLAHRTQISSGTLPVKSIL
jgi:hypothetical protein